MFLMLNILRRKNTVLILLLDGFFSLLKHILNIGTSHDGSRGSRYLGFFLKRFTYKISKNTQETRN